MKNKEKKDKNGRRKREKDDLIARVVMFHVHLDRFFSRGACFAGLATTEVTWKNLMATEKTTNDSVNFLFINAQIQSAD